MKIQSKTHTTEQMDLLYFTLIQKMGTKGVLDHFTQRDCDKIIQGYHRHITLVSEDLSKVNQPGLGKVTSKTKPTKAISGPEYAKKLALNKAAVSSLKHATVIKHKKAVDIFATQEPTNTGPPQVKKKAIKKKPFKYIDYFS